MSQFPAPDSIIAHRPPFLFIDELTELTAGKLATGLWNLTGDEAFFGGHFPGRPTLPGVLMVEAIAQVGAVALLSDDRYTGKLPLFGGIDSCRFRRQAVPGETLELSIEMTSLSSRGGKGSGTAKVNGELCCKADLLFVLVDS